LLGTGSDPRTSAERYSGGTRSYDIYYLLPKSPVKGGAFLGDAWKGYSMNATEPFVLRQWNNGTTRIGLEGSNLHKPFFHYCTRVLDFSCQTNLLWSIYAKIDYI